jgi:hypothetical protein
MDAHAIADTIATPRYTSSTAHKKTWKAKAKRGGEQNERHRRRRRKL